MKTFFEWSHYAKFITTFFHHSLLTFLRLIFEDEETEALRNSVINSFRQ